MTEVIQTPPLVYATPNIGFDWDNKGGQITYQIGISTIVPGARYTPTGVGITFTATTNFPAASSFTLPIQATEYYWEFGDNTIGYGNPVTHTYKVANLQAQAVLRVTDTLGREWYTRKQMYLKSMALSFFQMSLTGLK